MMVGFALLVAPSALSAAGNHPMAGCGLGYFAFGHEKTDNVMQILSATVNGTGTQTFGITSGTSGCTEDGAVKLARQLEVYTEMNLASLRREMALGDGEYVRTFTALLGATDENRGALLSVMKDNYSAIFPTPETDGTAMLRNLKRTLRANRAVLG